ncbi:PREDICTED: protein ACCUMULATION AND REPLICATION OF CHLOROPLASTS 3 isoform X2 [Erythranthe guttata]|uniref:protein ACCUMULATION AND REPLICATION OF CHLOROPLASTS 3 isoform X1 n=1 Tax=Erythranthe guttata TaxID=4155 RepID=UPI00064E11D8|nr:PREDICTED: protein ACCUMULATION AND REPLICATION OF CHLOROPLASTS 3 isoform X1 [Erythranthe guttata]XP_012846167.1 PREDICTED: protein ACCUMULATION AND REPLICATION OF CHLOROPLASTS 3 isoform X2 [Erythranthe guttata]|eukprot:XP_012846164.1 PREDICTED: protein ACCUMULATION AND REPLICATION OF CHLOROPLASTS 3 isoform X1 [Erythranthe guttata]
MNLFTDLFQNLEGQKCNFNQFNLLVQRRREQSRAPLLCPFSFPHHHPPPPPHHRRGTLPIRFQLSQSMKLVCPNTTGPHLLSVFSFPSLSILRTRRESGPKLSSRWNSNSAGLKLNCNCVSASNESCSNGRNNGGSDIWEESDECVEVIVVGSRKDAILDFCSASPFLSPVLRFWNILGYESELVRLQQRFTKQDSTPITVEDFSARQSRKAVILVASAAYGSDHITALEVLSNAKSANGFVVGIILKPFSFEGQRRLDEVKDLVSKLQKQANFCIVLDTDTLLENDLVTLDEALRTSNNAVLMAMNAISILLSGKHIKLLNTNDNSIRELQLPEFREIFESYSEARIGFGSGHNIKTSLLQAINDCPFLGVDIKDLDGVILCMIATSGIVNGNDANNALHEIRSITKCNGEIAVSVVHEPNLEPNTILATVIVFGYTRKQLAPRNGIFSSLGQRFPFIFNIFKKQHQKTNNSENAISSKDPRISDVINPPGAEETGVFSGKIGDIDEELFSIRDENSSAEREVELFESNFSSSAYDLNSEGTQMFKRELLTRGNQGPGQSAEVSKYGTNFSEATASVDSISIYKLPVGVKHLEELEDTSLTSNTKHEDNVKKQHHDAPSVSWSGLTNVDFNNKGNITGNTKKHGGLSVRAASMLETERDSQKKWNRTVEMKYRGGTYRGRAQGGLPEGKGRLLLGDGSIYEGMWRYGKRSGMGTFYFNNGDVFQGSWRDDVMHGKGWIYFHTGDRWFANFWKGKANGEGRFYSKLGDVFFGHFKEGWRNGNFLRINVDGTRSQELWDEGVLVSEKQLDPNAELG